MTLRTSDDEAQLLRVSGDVRVVLVSGFVQLSVGDGGSVRTKVDRRRLLPVLFHRCLHIPTTYVQAGVRLLLPADGS